VVTRTYTIEEPSGSPPVPAGLSGELRVVLSWEAASGATGYRVRRTDTGGTVEVYAGPLTTYTDTPDAGTSPSYTVSAHDDDAESAESDPVAFLLTMPSGTVQLRPRISRGR
jgi:hypothetical protein